MKVTLLSDLLDTIVCPASDIQSVDNFFSVGCAIVGTPQPQKDAAAQADVQRQAYGVSMLKDFRRPILPGSGHKDQYKIFDTDTTLINDLYVPGHWIDEDAFFHVHFPVSIATPLSSTFLGKDWRFVALAWIAVIDSKEVPSKMVFTAFDSTGRKVMAMVEPDVLDAFKAVAKVVKKNLAVEVPGPTCIRCSRSEVCKRLQAVLDPVMEGAEEPMPKDKTAVAAALFYQRMELETRIEVLEDKKRKTDQLLSKLCVDGVLKIGGEAILLPRRKSAQWDFGRALRVLQAQGLWHDSYGSIKVGALQAAMEDMPSDVRKKLEPAKVETITEPSISEAAKHARTNPTQVLRGVTFRR